MEGKDIWIVKWYQYNFTDNDADTIFKKCENEEEVKSLLTDHPDAYVTKVKEYDIVIYHNFPQYCGKEPRVKGILGVREGYILEEGFSHHYGRLIIIRCHKTPVPKWAPAGNTMTDLQTFKRFPDLDRGSLTIAVLDDGSLISDFEGATTIENLEILQRCALPGNFDHWYFEHTIEPSKDGMESENCLARALTR